MREKIKTYRTLPWILTIIALAACGAETNTVDSSSLELDFEGLNLHYSSPGCPAFEDRELVYLSDEITADETWTCEQLVVLEGKTFVTAGATLTIDAGHVVVGDLGGALIVTREGRLDAKGQASAPVVFTSALPVGSRERGDWAGVVLLGDARINVPGGSNQIEGIDPTDPRGGYGGDDDAHDCGSLRYTRIEFAGSEFSIDNELNGLTVAACGSSTVLDYVQIHRGLDDGIEFFGGTASVRHLVVTGAKDDSIDWDEGWTGGVEYAVVQQYAGSGDSGIEADNLGDDHGALPRSAPSLSNITLLGTDEASGNQTGIVLRRGTGATIERTIIAGFSNEGLDIRDEQTASGAADGTLRIQTTLFFASGADGMQYAALEPLDGSEDDDDAGFDEVAFIANADAQNLIGVDPLLTDPFNPKLPNYQPSLESPVFLEQGFIGALEPGGEDWTAGWTAYPSN